MEKIETKINDKNKWENEKELKICKKNQKC